MLVLVALDLVQKELHRLLLVLEYQVKEMLVVKEILVTTLQAVAAVQVL
jgi:hypothetical protein